MAKLETVPGVDPSAMMGIPGDAVAVKQLESRMETKETTPVKSKEISHTNISMGLDVITNQYIYKGTYTWSVSDAPGKVIALFPIHPDSCNQYTQHVYQMFNSWVGGQKARVRIIGTAFYGGGLFFVRIPPNFTIDAINAMDLQGFTAFPHADMDPKNLSSIDMDLQDYRSEHFHQGDLTLDEARSFAGWLAIVVNARLVTQSTDIHSLDLRVEMAGDFIFRVPRPIRTTESKGTDASGPLTARSLIIGHLNGCDDAVTDNGLTRLTISQDDNGWRDWLRNGHIFAKATTGWSIGTQEVDKLVTGGRNRAQWLAIIAEARGQYDTAKYLPMSNYEWVVEYGYETTGCTHIDMFPQRQHQSTIEQCSWKQMNFINGLSNTMCWGSANDAETEFGVLENIDIHYEYYGQPVVRCKMSANTKNNGVMCFDYGFPNQVDRNRVITQANVNQFCNFRLPLPPGEGYVNFVTNHNTCVNLQAQEVGRDVREFADKWPGNDAALYEVIDNKGNILTMVKLRRNGLMSAPCAKVAIGFSGEMQFRFKQWIPEDKAFPLPPSVKQAYMAQMYEHKMNKLVAKLEKKVLAREQTSGSM